MPDSAEDHYSRYSIFEATPVETALTSTTQAIPEFRRQIKLFNATLNERFSQDAPIAGLVMERARFIDILLRQAWQRHIPAHFSSPALIAVGGYGRGELHPCSDIDIMVLLEAELQSQSEMSALENFITFLWDIGLEIGHSVRTLQQCVTEAEKDITVATNLMESRCLIGSDTLYNQMLEQTGPAHTWPSKLFFEAKWKEQKLRHQKFHDTAYNLEPNIKESPGGLRDIQMIGWVTKRHFGDRTLHDLVKREFLTEAEYDALMEGQNFLWKIRFALHTITGRREDRLLFDYQRTLATMFGYSDESAQDARSNGQPDFSRNRMRRAADGPRLGVELFMWEYYRTVMELRRLNEMLLQLYQEAILFPEDSEQDIIPINRRFQSCKGFIEVVNDNIFQRYPFALLEIYLLIQQHQELKGIRASTIRLIRQHRYLINEEYRRDLRCQSLFMEIFRQPNGLTHVLRRMNRHGILAAYIPAFKKIVGLMQYDLFHVYTVDQHTLFVVRNLRRFTVEKFKHEFPLCSRIISHIPKPEVLYLAGLFHDIAKGRGGDHSVLGAEEIRLFCKQHSIGRHDTELLAWLIENHLVMSATAQHKDISDPDVINEFASKIADRVRLDYLYLLTVADMRATNPNIWNSWKDALLIELYKQTRRALDRGLENPLDKKERIHDVQSLARKNLLDKQLSDEKISAFFANLPDDYFLKHNASDIAWHASCILAEGDNIPHQAYMRNNDETGRTEILVYTPALNSLFASLTGTLDRLGINIIEAKLITNDNNYAIDTFGILEHTGKPVDNSHRQREIIERIKTCLQSEKQPVLNPLQEANRRIEHFSQPATVEFFQDQNHQRTIMEVVSTDRQGLLSRIAYAILQSNIDITAAKITTLGALADDIFFITDMQGKPVTEPEQLQALKQTIIEYLEPGSKHS